MMQHVVEILFVVNGENVPVTTDQIWTLAAVKDVALSRSGNTGRPPKEWEVRDMDGKLLDQSKQIQELNIHDGDRLFVQLEMAGCFVHSTEAVTYIPWPREAAVTCSVCDDTGEVDDLKCCCRMTLWELMDEIATFVPEVEQHAAWHTMREHSIDCDMCEQAELWNDINRALDICMDNRDAAQRQAVRYLRSCWRLHRAWRRERAKGIT